MVQILQMILVVGDVCKVHYEAVKRRKKEEGARQLWKVQSHVRPSNGLHETFGFDLALTNMTICGVTPTA